MSYSALFTSGLSLASQPRNELEAQAASKPYSLQINVHPGTPRPRLRKRRSSLIISVSPISAVKSPLRTANEALRATLRSPREGSFLEAIQNGTKLKTIRRKTSNSPIEPPSFPAPTTPLPSIPVEFLRTPSSSLPPTPKDDTSSSPIISEPTFTFTSRPPWARPYEPSRKSSYLLPPFGRPRSSSASGREPLTSSPYAANRSADDLDISMVEEKDVSPAFWLDQDEDMKENDS